MEQVVSRETNEAIQAFREAERARAHLAHREAHLSTLVERMPYDELDVYATQTEPVREAVDEVIARIPDVAESTWRQMLSRAVNT